MYFDLAIANINTEHRVVMGGGEGQAHLCVNL